jgi:Tfp pilus assembly protein FimV
MVAIHIPRPAGEWAPAPQVAPDVAPDRTPVRERPRRLPDRATRVRRRRLVVLVAGIVLAFALVGAVQVVADLGSGREGSPRPERISGGEYVVQPGDTLWSIAGRLDPDADPRAVVDALRAANGGADLQVGDRLDLDIG